MVTTCPQLPHPSLPWIPHTTSGNDWSPGEAQVTQQLEPVSTARKTRDCEVLQLELCRASMRRVPQAGGSPGTSSLTHLEMYMRDCLAGDQRRVAVGPSMLGCRLLQRGRRGGLDFRARRASSSWSPGKATICHEDAAHERMLYTNMTLRAGNTGVA
ncbi:hypothetical protein OH77DRAFT_613445 [Trametes cingulata]|nr:hypothetical protein OH77DRAFT_613445 [Trametes cingulata]